MSQQVLCDGCDEPIDTSKPYYTVNVQQVAAQAESPAGSPVMMASGAMVTRDFHEEHLPEGLVPE